DLNSLRRALETGDLGENKSLGGLVEQVHAIRVGSANSIGFQQGSSQLLKDYEVWGTRPPLAVMHRDDALPKNWNAEQAAHVYGYLVATVQSQYDEAAKQRRSPPVSPELLDSLRLVKGRLMPLPHRPFGPVANVWETDFATQMSR